MKKQRETDSSLIKLIRKRKNHPILFFGQFSLLLMSISIFYILAIISLTWTTAIYIIFHISRFLEYESSLYPPVTGVLLLLLFVGIPFFTGLYRLIRFYKRMPFGVEIQQKHAPQLFETLTDISHDLKTPKISRVFLTMEAFNIYDQTLTDSKLRILPASLYLGFPIFLAMTPSHVNGNLAELCYELKNGSAFFNRWVYIVLQLLDHTVDAASYGIKNLEDTVIYRKLPHIVTNYLLAYNWQKQFTSDQIAARYIGPQRYGEMLIQSAINSMRLEQEFWPQIHYIAQKNEAVIEDFYEKMSDFLAKPVSEEQMKIYLYNLEQSNEEPLDVQPSIAHRLDVLDIDIKQVAIDTNEAGSYFLSDEYRSIINFLGKTWQEVHMEEWKAYYAEIHQERIIIDKYKKKIIEEGPLPYDDVTEFIHLAEHLEPEGMLREFREFNQCHPNHQEVLLLIGKTLVYQENLEGEKYLKQVMEIDPRYITPALNIIRDYYLRHGEFEQAELIKKKMFAFVKEYNKADNERLTLNDMNRYIEHDLTSHQIRIFRDNFQKIPYIEEVYAAKMDVTILPKMPAYLLGVVFKKPWYGLKNRISDNLRFEKLLKLFPDQEFVYFALLNDPDQANAKLIKRVKSLENSRIFKR